MIGVINTGRQWWGDDRLVTVRLVTNPRNDLEFERAAEALVDQAQTPEELERLLRLRYHRTRVVRGVTDITERWYVYRDGRWVDSRDR